MLVNDLGVRKVHVALMGVLALALAALAFLAMGGGPAFELVRYIGKSVNFWIRVLNAIMNGADYATLVLMIGSGLAGAVARIGFYVIRRYVRRYGLRAAAWL